MTSPDDGPTAGDGPIASAFGTASQLRGARVFHPRGVVVIAAWHPGAIREPLGPILGSGPRRCLLRVSHAVGLPPGLPDILGVAVKVPDAHGPDRDQDLLLASTGRGRLGRRLLLPRRSLSRTTYSTLLPYRIAGHGIAPLVARTADEERTLTYADLVAEGSDVRLPDLEIRIGRRDGPLLATVHPDGLAVAEDDPTLAFDPWHTGPGLRPTGWLNHLRRPTYAASRRGRRRADG